MSDFGKHLQHYRLKTVDPNSDPPKPLTQEELAELMSVHEKMISFWETGTRKISYRRRNLQIGLVKVLHIYGGIQTVDEANGLLLLGRYDPLSAEECQEIDAKWMVAPPATSPTVSPPVLPQAIFYPSWRAVYDWLDGFFRWSEADDHARMSWAGMVIWSLGVVNGRLTPDHFLTLLIASLLWIAAIWLLVPALQWPLTPQSVLQEAVARFMGGWFGLPLLLALFTKADGVAQDRQPWAKLLFLKFTGALVGFNLVALLLLIAAAGWYYLLLPPLLWGWRVAAVLPLLLGHIAARRIPADRLKMHPGELQPHPVDYWFLGMYLLTGLLVGVVLYGGYRFWLNPAVGTSFLLVVLGVALWERQKKRPLFPPLLIFLLGCALPLLIAWLLLFVSPIGHAAIDTLAAASETGLGLAYVISLWSLWLTLQLRRPPIFRQLMLGGLLLVVGGLSFYLLAREMMPVWLNLLGFVAVSLGVIRRGYG